MCQRTEIRKYRETMAREKERLTKKSSKRSYTDYEFLSSQDKKLRKRIKGLSTALLGEKKII